MKSAVLSFTFLAALSCTAAAQQPAPSIPPQASDEKPATTADGTPACGASIAKSLPPGVYRVGGSVSPPTPKHTPEATFSNEARNYYKQQHLKFFDAKSLVQLTVDEHRMPQDMCVLKEAGYGLDKKAFQAVAKYRFAPATMNSQPVPVRLSVEVDFKLQ